MSDDNMLYGVRLGIYNGVECWAIHTVIDEGEAFFLESSPGLTSKLQAERLLTLVQGRPAVLLEGQMPEIVPLLPLFKN